ncbi:MAG: single-stranded-DNA-specific exonuclease RecJ [Flavobacteriaceae bacterium]|nr:single-stranded-DNA-specific exonuclease RecJ [Flavobacteriaceae bacterium]
MRWHLKSHPNPKIKTHLAEVLQVSPVVAHLLAQRGIETYEDAKDYFRPHWDQLHDPFLMKDMDRAVDRLNKALSEEENIMVFGDYDVDGTTAVSLITHYLSMLSAHATPYIPDRYKEGYGLSKAGIDKAIQEGIKLLICLDCGIKANELVNYAQTHGVDVIICDHHTPGDILPKAYAVLDPKRSDCTYPFEELCGCGVAFKLVQAHVLHSGGDPESIRPYLDLVATAIAADIVPMIGENRVLTYFGLEVLNKSPRPGLKVLIGERFAKVTDLVFLLAPRINAAGRMKHATHAVELLLCTDLDQAHVHAEAIESFNTQRKELDREVTQQALKQIKRSKDENKAATVVYDPNWHKGVIGIVASRLTETYYRPTVVFTQSGSQLAASVRSVRGFNVYAALAACSEHMLQFGGHKYAAGLTILPEQYPAFKQAFENQVSKTLLPEHKTPTLNIDIEIKLSDLTPKLYRIIDQMGPFGPGNMQPVFVARDVRDTGGARCVGVDQNHLKAQFTSKDSHRLDAIGFGMGASLENLKSQENCSIAFVLDENEWNGQKRLQLRLKGVE